MHLAVPNGNLHTVLGGGRVSEGLFFAKGAYGNVTEELFVLSLLLCSLVPCSVQVNICIPQLGRAPPPPRMHTHKHTEAGCVCWAASVASVTSGRAV